MKPRYFVKLKLWLPLWLRVHVVTNSVYSVSATTPSRIHLFRGATNVALSECSVQKRSIPTGLGS